MKKFFGYIFFKRYFYQKLQYENKVKIKLFVYSFDEIIDSRLVQLCV